MLGNATWTPAYSEAPSRALVVGNGLLEENQTILARTDEAKSEGSVAEDQHASGGTITTAAGKGASRGVRCRRRSHLEPDLRTKETLQIRIRAQFSLRLPRSWVRHRHKRRANFGRCPHSRWYSNSELHHNRTRWHQRHWHGTVNGNGTWEFTTGPLGEGLQNFTAIDTDASGDASNASSVFSARVELYREARPQAAGSTWMGQNIRGVVFGLYPIWNTSRVRASISYVCRLLGR